jgi:UPF0716 family protein affecting phage T7 exclusion
VHRFLKYFLIVFLIVDISSLLLIVDYAGWKFFFYQLCGTAMLGLAVSCYILLRYGSLILDYIEQNIFNDRMMYKTNNIEQKIPGDKVMDKSLLFFAGGLLILPGILTDTIGLVLLLSFIRRLVLKKLTVL